MCTQCLKSLCCAAVKKQLCLEQMPTLHIVEQHTCLVMLPGVSWRTCICCSAFSPDKASPSLPSRPLPLVYQGLGPRFWYFLLILIIIIITVSQWTHTLNRTRSTPSNQWSSCCRNCLSPQSYLQVLETVWAAALSTRCSFINYT